MLFHKGVLPSTALLSMHAATLHALALYATMYATTVYAKFAFTLHARLSTGV